LKGQGKEKAYSKTLLPPKPPSFSEEKEAKDFLKGQGKEKAYSKTLLPQKPPGKDGRLFPFARGSAFISSPGSKNARYGPGVFRIVRPSAEGVPVSLPPEGPNPQKVLRTFPGTPPGRWLAERDGRSFDSLPPRGRGTACGGRSFSSLSFLLRSPFLFPLLQSPCGRQLPRGGSLSGRGTACGGRNPRCLPLEGGGSRSETEEVSPRCLFSFLP